MKKKIVVIMMAAIMAFGSLAGCSHRSDDGASAAATSASASTAGTSSYEFSTESYMKGLTALDYVTLKDYKDFTVRVEPALPVTDEDVQAEIDNELAMESTMEEVTDHDDVKNGDWVNIDYTGTIDGEEFDGGSAEGQDLEIGSGDFIDGFESGLIGHKKGDEVTLNLKYPDDYGEDDLNGKDVVFTVKINSIEKETYPELTDEYVAAAGYTDDDGNKITTVDAFKKYIRKNLEEERQEDYDNAVNTAVSDYLANNNEVTPPDSLVDRLEEEYIESLKQTADDYGMTFEELMNGYGFNDSSEYNKEIHSSVVDYAGYILILNAIAEKENIDFSDEEYEKAKKAEAAQYGYTSGDEGFFADIDDDKSYRDILKLFYIRDWVRDTVHVEAPETADGAATASTASTASAAESADAGATENN